MQAEIAIITSAERIVNLGSRMESGYFKRDNGDVHRAAANIIVSKSRAARGSVCNVLLSRVIRTTYCTVFRSTGRGKLIGGLILIHNFDAGDFAPRPCNCGFGFSLCGSIYRVGDQPLLRISRFKFE